MYISVKQAAEKSFDEYHVKHNLGAMKKLFAGYLNERLDSYLAIQEDFKI